VTVRFTPEPGVVADLARSEAAQEVTVAAAEEGMAYAVAVAPRDTGEYADSFEVREELIQTPTGAVAGAVLSNAAAHAVHVEWTDGYHVLAQAIDHMEVG